MKARECCIFRCGFLLEQERSWHMVKQFPQGQIEFRLDHQQSGQSPAFWLPTSPDKPKAEFYPEPVTRSEPLIMKILGVSLAGFWL